MGVVHVYEQSQIAAARRRAAAVAAKLGGDGNAVSNVSIIATELATNQVRHAHGGELLIQPWKDAEGSGIEILALDKGRGMADVADCFRDGYSTAGTPGTGLGAVARLATVMDIWSRPGMGTALLARVRLCQPSRDAAPPFAWGGISRPAAGEEECGDRWSVVYSRTRIAFLVVDGLGHGPHAATAAETAVRIFQDRALKEGPVGAVQAIHRGLVSTRGAAAAVAEMRSDDLDLIFAGVGNISGTLLSDGQTKRAVSMAGTLGHAMRTVREFSYRAAPGSVWVMNSDGLMTNWSLADYPGLLMRHPALIAGVICRDFRRGRDDAVVLVARRTA